MTTIPDDIREQSWDIARRAIVHAWDVTPSRGESHLAEAVAQALAAERERCAKFADAWDNPSALRLAAGEMTAQEMRTARAVARGIAAAIRSQTP